MEVLNLSITFIENIFIRGLFISILSIMVAGRIFKKDTCNAFAIIKGIIWVYAGLNICYYLVACFSPSTMNSIWIRATGRYIFVYYLMLVPNTILPWFLLFKKLGRNQYVLLAMSFLMNDDWLFELYSIYNADIQRTYITNRISFNFLWFIALQGFFVGSVIYAIGSVIKRKKSDVNISVS